MALTIAEVAQAMQVSLAARLREHRNPIGRAQGSNIK
jgi:hypothetical protein